MPCCDWLSSFVSLYLSLRTGILTIDDMTGCWRFVRQHEVPILTYSQRAWETLFYMALYLLNGIDNGYSLAILSTNILSVLLSSSSWALKSSNFNKVKSSETSSCLVGTSYRWVKRRSIVIELVWFTSKCASKKVNALFFNCHSE